MRGCDALLAGNCDRACNVQGSPPAVGYFGFSLKNPMNAVGDVFFGAHVALDLLSKS